MTLALRRPPLHSPLNGHRREAQFARVMAGRGITLERPARRFQFKRSSYLPDFYAPSEGVYYEVIGSRQRWEFIYPKLDLMDLVYPGVTLRVVKPNGESMPIRLERRSARWRVPFAAQLQGALDGRGWTLKRLGEELGLPPLHLSQALCGDHLSAGRRHETTERIRRWLIPTP